MPAIRLNLPCGWVIVSPSGDAERKGKLTPHHVKAYSKTTNQFSWYRTENRFESVFDITCVEDAIAAQECVDKAGIKSYPLGNGSNTFFSTTNIKTAIFRNRLPESWTDIGDDCFEVSSSTKLLKLLRFLYKEKRVGPYYLASVPATVGGAITMNAGTGLKDHQYISDHLEKVTLISKGRVRELRRDDCEFGHRRSIFSETEGSFIVSAVFRFPRTTFSSDPIKERMDWSRESQDWASPNCGSVFRVRHPKVERILHKFFCRGKTRWSRKTRNWISNDAETTWRLRWLLRISIAMHRILGKKCELEIRRIS